MQFRDAISRNRVLFNRRGCSTWWSKACDVSAVRLAWRPRQFNRSVVSIGAIR